MPPGTFRRELSEFRDWCQSVGHVTTYEEGNVTCKVGADSVTLSNKGRIHGDVGRELEAEYVTQPNSEIQQTTETYRFERTVDSLGVSNGTLYLRGRRQHMDPEFDASHEFQLKIRRNPE